MGGGASPSRPKDGPWECWFAILLRKRIKGGRPYNVPLLVRPVSRSSTGSSSQER